MHDHYGRELKVGDFVLIPARIVDLQPTPDFCNVTLETVFGRRPDGAKESVHAINTGVLVRANEGERHRALFPYQKPEPVTSAGNS